MRLKLILTLLTVLFCFAMGVNADTVSFSKVSEWGTGDYECGAVKGNYVYSGGYGSGVEVVDISNPSSPIRVKKIDSSKQFKTSVISGNYLYMGGYSIGIHVYDISNPSSPVYLRTVSPSESALSMVVHQELLITRNNSGIMLHDISNPGTPLYKGFYSDTGSFNHFGVSGNYIFYAVDDYSNGPTIRILDISKPHAPVLAYSYTNEEFKKHGGVFLTLGISGNYLYISGRTYPANEEKWVILNITNPVSPVLVKTKLLPMGYRMFLNNQSAYIIDYENKLKSIDISNPADPVAVGSVDIETKPADMKISGNRFFLWCKDNGMLIYDLSSPGNPSLISHLNETAMFNSVVLSSHYAYLPGDTTLKVFDISNPAVPALTGYSIGGGEDAVLSGNLLYSMEWYGFRITNISNPSAPVSIYVTEKIDYDEVYSMAVSGNNLYFSDGDHGLTTCDISNPNNPIEGMGSHIHGVDGYGIYLASRGNYLYIRTDSNFYIFDTSQKPDAPMLGKIEIPSSSYINKVYVDSTGKYAYLTQDSLIKVIDVSNPSAPVQVGSIDTGANTIECIKNDGVYIYAATQSKGIMVYDTTNLSNIQLVGNWTGTSDVRSIDLKGSMVCAVGDKDGKLYILNVTYIPSPVITVTSPVGGETWNAGTTHGITWNSMYVSGPVTISVYKNNTLYSTLGTADVSAGAFSWAIPAKFPAGNDYKIRVYQGSAEDYSDSNFSIESQPQITLSKTSLHFKAVKGIQTSPQTVGIINGGGGVLNWTVQTTQSWITVTPNSGTGNKNIEVSVNPSGLAVGNYTGTISVSDLEAINSPQVIQVTLTVSETGTVPFGEFSTPANAATVSGSIPVTGWALDDMEVTSVKIYRSPVTGEASVENVYIGDAIFIEGSRPDVEIAYPDFPFNYRAGWGYMLLTNMLPNNGNGTFTLYAKATDREGNTVTLGTKTITIDNAHAVKPFGAIDTPFQGGEVSGSEYVNFGWVLTPMPNTVPVDGSTITVWVDGVAIGHPGYNVYREDIATLFPGYMNSNGAGGYYYFDSTKYADGLHTISWTVEDNAGNQDGIGSRYFTINNGDGANGILTGQNLSPNKSFCGAGVRSTLFKKRPAGGFEKDKKEINNLEVNELGHIEISLPGCMEGYMVVGEERRALPVGSTLDTVNGVFYWNPGPGFVGNYTLEFVCSGSDGVIKKNTVEVRID